MSQVHQHIVTGKKQRDNYMQTWKMNYPKEMFDNLEKQVYIQGERLSE